MGTSRTGTARWKNLRRQAIHLAQQQGQTHCPCGAQLNYTLGKQPNSAEADHITPWANGGTDTLDNIRIICRHCNQSRGNRTHTPPRPKSITNLVAW